MRFVNDGLGDCLNWTAFRNHLFLYNDGNNNTTTTRQGGGVAGRIHVTYISHATSMGIGPSMKESYLDLAAEDDPIDYITNFEDDILCRRHWLVDLHAAYEHYKRFADNDVPLLASAYNSNRTAVWEDDESNGAATTTNPKNCTRGCVVWKRLIYGVNFFSDAVTFERVILRAFADDYRAYNGQRPPWAASLRAWDEWIMDEYYEHLPIEKVVVVGGRRRRRRPRAALILSPSLLQHVSKSWSLHAENQEQAKDYVSSSSAD